MGVLNVTPDSFSDGGQFASREKAVRQALQLEQAGAAIIDVGGESTRPGAHPVGLQQELDRVIPVIEGIRARSECSISVDTSKSKVMVEAIRAGANMVNDVTALNGEDAVAVVAAHQVPVVLMHMQGRPRSMQQAPEYGDVVREISDFLLERVRVCVAAGIKPDRILLDPGFGFGKTLAHNVALLGCLPQIVELGHPVLAGLSRKSMLGQITGRDDPKQRVPASVAAALLAVQAGAAIVRVHDVAETIDAIKVWQAVREQKLETT